MTSSCKEAVKFIVRSRLSKAVALGNMLAIASTVAMPNTAYAGGESLLEEITVTARKREESLQDTPISVAAFTGEGLEQRGLSDVSNVGDLTPNMVFNVAAPISGSSSAATVFIRGVGQNDFTPNTDPGVGIYVDGVYYARSVGAVLDLLDLERIEILRGPQGTLFGRNTIGGAINITSKEPGTELGGNGTVVVGADSRIDVSATVDLPINDQWRANVALLSKQRDGYVTRLQDGIKLGDENTKAARAKVIFEPNDDVKLRLIADYTKEDEESAPNVPININAAGFPFAALYNDRTPGCYENFAGPGTGNAPASAFGNPLCYNSQWETSGLYETNETGPSKSEMESWGLSFTANWQLSEDILFTSITAYRELDAFFARNADHSPLVIFHSTDGMKQEQLSQEFQLSGSSFDNSLDWVMGAYYFEEQADNPNTLDTSIFRQLSGGSVDNDNFAFFGEATYALTERLALTLGGRYTEETKRFTPDQYYLDTPVPGAPPAGLRLLDKVESTQSFSEFTPRAILAYDISDDVMVYGSFSKGFKSGGFTQRYQRPMEGGKPLTFDPEYVDTYELGFKAEWPEQGLRLNGAVFDSSYTDIQVSFNPPNVSNTVTGNAAEAEMSGAELELTFTPIRGLMIEGGAGYLDAKYKEIDASVVSVTVADKLLKAPRWTFNLGLSYAFDIENIGSLTPRFDWSYTSEFENESRNSPYTREPGYHVANVSFTFLDTSEQWQVIAGATNITDEEYLISADTNDAYGIAEGVYARPREMYLSVKRFF